MKKPTNSLSRAVKELKAERDKVFTLMSVNQGPGCGIEEYCPPKDWRSAIYRRVWEAQNDKI